MSFIKLIIKGQKEYLDMISKDTSRIITKIEIKHEYHL